jgi:hypothetical protein
MVDEEGDEEVGSNDDDGLMVETKPNCFYKNHKSYDMNSSHKTTAVQDGYLGSFGTFPFRSTCDKVRDKVLVGMK